MNTTPSSSPDLESRAALREQDERRLRLTFLRMTDLGVEMVHLVTAQAREEALAPAPAPTPTKLPELVIAYDRLMRSLRRTALLILKFTAPEPARTPAAPRPGSARKPAAQPAVEELSDEDVANMSDEEIEERLEALDRLEGLEGVEDDDDAEFAGMTHEEIVLAILKDPDGSGRSAADGAPRPARPNPGITPARAGLPVPPRHGWSADAARGESTRPNGAKGCRDP